MSEGLAAERPLPSSPPPLAPPQAPPYYPPPPQQQQQPPPPPQPAYNNGQLYGGFRAPYPNQGPAAAPAAAPAPPAAGPSQELTQTATIRNAVNLKKATLEATPLPGEPRKLALSFTFDASQPCAVTTFVMATEEPSRGCRLTPAAQPPPPAVAYPKGLGLRFPPPHGAGAPPPQHVLDLSLYGEAQLTAPDRDTYPLAIRLETVTGERAGWLAGWLAGRGGGMLCEGG